MKQSLRQTAWPLMGQLTWFLLILVIWLGFAFTASIDPDYTAGELLDHLLAWSETGQLYRPLSAAPYRVLNYPPLFLLVVDGVRNIGLSPLLAGRLVNLMAFVMASVAFFRWLRSAGTSRAGTWFVIALLGTSFPILYSLGQFHLQMTAVALSLWGLYLLRAPDSVLRVVTAGVLLATACFVKQTQVITLLIALLWLLRYQRRFVLQYLLSVVLVSCAGALWLHLIYGIEVWNHLLVYTVGTYSMDQWLEQVACHVLPWCFFVGFALWLAKKHADERSDLRFWYFAGSSLWILAAARDGSSYQYFIGWSFATLLWIGPWLGQLVDSGFAIRPRIITLLLLIQIIGADLGVAAVLTTHVLKGRVMEASLAKLCELIPAEAHWVPAGSPGLIRACGRIPAHHPFIMASLAKQGLWDQSDFVNELARGHYPVLIMPFDPRQALSGVHGSRWTPEMIDAIRSQYTITEQLGDWWILKPKST